jgi:CubicO group peptidase (beta-lactamase class C family)
MQPAVPAPAPWPTVQPEEAGFVPDLAERLDWGVRAGLLRDLHAVVAVRQGKVVLERYWTGEDEAWGYPLGPVAFEPAVLHDLRSVTKSIVGLLYGIALARGLVPPPEAPLYAQFPDYADLATPERAGITVAHALTMSLGLEWDELRRPYTDPENSEIMMENAADRLRFILERPVAAAPGASWGYSGGATALVGALIARGTGQPLPEFAREALFAPLGIDRFEWTAGKDGVASAASGLRLTAHDLLRIGAALLDEGTPGKNWGGWWGEGLAGEVVPASWVKRSLTPALPTGDGLDYGYLWFLGHAPAPAFPDAPPTWAGGFGNGGQRLWLLPAAGLACVIFSGAYNRPDAWVTPTRVWREILLANLLRA